LQKIACIILRFSRENSLGFPTRTFDHSTAFKGKGIERNRNRVFKEHRKQVSEQAERIKGEQIHDGI